MSIETCPCGSDKTIENCCGVYHESVSAPTALALMKSRYVAYAIGDVVKTTHPLRQHNLSKKEIKQWSSENTWQSLEIVTSIEEGPVKAAVEFKASFLDKKGKSIVHHELSAFDKIQGRWYYSNGRIDPESNAKLNRNDPCSCGSGKKFKKCCG